MKSEKRFLFSEVCFFILFVLVALLLIGSLVAVLLIVFSKPLVENWNCKFLENIAEDLVIYEDTKAHFLVAAQFLLENFF